MNTSYNIFRSTRGISSDHRVSISQAISDGLAPDGGLYVPVEFPSYNIEKFLKMDKIVERAITFLEPFFENDPLKQYLREICENTFEFRIPIINLTEDFSILELYHGPTGAFKDIGAKFLAECFGHLHGNYTILVATSGDTGSAVASAFYDQPGVNVFILYPKGKISDFQENQMKYFGKNVSAISVKGDFDDCQELVKSAFQMKSTKERYNLTSANSINIGRLLPQCIYYVHSSLDYYRDTGKFANFIVPTGNMGNVLACIWVKIMGFPIGDITIATNANRTIVDYFETGELVTNPSIQTLANAMDVGDPSNIERYLDLVQEFPNKIGEITAYTVSDHQIKETMKSIYQQFDYIICPHTSTAVDVYSKTTQNNNIAVATADPYKFREIVEEVLGIEVEIPHQLTCYLNVDKDGKDINPNLDELIEILSD